MVHIHVEKTGGSTLREFLVRQFGAYSVLHFDPVTRRVVRVGERRLSSDSKAHAIGKRMLVWPFGPLLVGATYEFVRRHDAPRVYDLSNLPKSYSAISGHFCAEEVVAVIPPSGARYVTLLRDPLTRALSHFGHWRRTRGRSHFRAHVDYDPRMHFMDFAESPPLINIYSQALGGNVGIFHRIGVTERIHPFLKSIGLIDGVEPVRRFNAAPPIASLGMSTMTDSQRSHFRRLNAEDFKLYEEVRRRWISQA